jgi:hypothetical protein
MLAGMQANIGTQFEKGGGQATREETSNKRQQEKKRVTRLKK